MDLVCGVRSRISGRPLSTPRFLKISYRGDPKVSLWIFGGGDGREDRGVAGCPFGSRRSAPGPSRHCMDFPYSGHAVEKEGKSAKNSVFGAEPISPLQLQNDAQNANFGLQSHLKMKLNPRRMLFRSMMTPKGSELIKNLTTMHENGGARRM